MKQFVEDMRAWLLLALMGVILGVVAILCGICYPVEQTFSYIKGRLK